MNPGEEVGRRAPSRAVSSAVAVAAAAIAASVALSAATAAPQADAPASASAKGTKALKKRLAALEARVAAVEGRAATPGPQGPQGPAGATNVVVRTSSSNIGGGVNSSPFGLSCAPGEVATGGGVGFASHQPGDRVAQSMPTSNGLVATDGQVPTGWLGAVFNSGGPRTATVWAICASP